MALIKLLPGVVFGLHTGVARHKIGRRDAGNVKAYFGLRITDKMTERTDLFQRGITEIWIEEQARKYRDKRTGIYTERVSYYCCIRINFSRVLGLGNTCIMPYIDTNIKKVIAKVTKTLGNIGLTGENKEFEEWTVVRLDSAIEVTEQEKEELLMAEMSRKVNIGVSKKKKLKLFPVSGADPKALERESVRFGNQSYVWNIYRKAPELKKKLAEKQEKGISVTHEEIEEAREMSGVLRLERQNMECAVKRLLPHRVVSDLALSDVREGILQIMTGEIAMVFGKDDFTVDPDFETEFDISTLPGIYGRIADETVPQVQKRDYHSFPQPKLCGDGRYHANIPLYDYLRLRGEYEEEQFRQMIEDTSAASNGCVEKKHHKSIAGKTIEEYELKVMAVLKSSYRTNYIAKILTMNTQHLPDDYDMNAPFSKPIYQTISEACDKSLDAIRRFGDTAQIEKVREEARNIVEGDLDELIISEVATAQDAEWHKYIQNIKKAGGDGNV